MTEVGDLGDLAPREAIGRVLAARSGAYITARGVTDELIRVGYQWPRRNARPNYERVYHTLSAMLLDGQVERRRLLDGWAWRVRA